MEQLKQLLDQKDELSEKIDELQIAMIKARGRKLAFMAAELDDLEELKASVKVQIKQMRRGEAPAAATPAGAAGIPPPAKKGPAPRRRNSRIVKRKAKRKNKLFEAATTPPAKPRSQADEEADAALEAQVAALEQQVLALEDRTERKYYELYSQKMALYKQEEELYKREHQVLAVSLDVDPIVRHVIYCQRAARRKLMRRRWKGDRPMMAPIVEEYVRSDASKGERARWALVMKVYESQHNYVKCLGVAVDKYLVPLRKTNSHASGCTREDIQVMFGSLEVIASLDSDVLQGLHSRLYGRFSHTSIGDVFVQMDPLFSLYEDYCRTYDEMITKLSKMQRSNKLFASFMNSLYERSGIKAPLAALLEMPAQRLFEYKTIISALLKATSPEHADYHYFKSTLSKVSQSIKNVERMQAVKKAAQVLKSLNKKISGLSESLVVQGRVLLGQFDVDEVSPENRPVCVYVFNDMLLRVDPVKKKYIDTVTLLGLKLTSLPDSSYRFNAFEINKNIQGPWVYTCADYGEKVRIEKLIHKSLREQSSGVAGMQSAKRPSMGIFRAKLGAAVGVQSDRLRRVPQDSLAKLKSAGIYSSLLECLSAEDGEALKAVASKKKALQAAVQSLESEGEVLECVPICDTPEYVAALTPTVGKQWVVAVIGDTVRDIVASKSLTIDNVSEMKKLCMPLISNVLANLESIPMLFCAFIHKWRAAASAKLHDNAKADAAAVDYLFKILISPAIRHPSAFKLLGPMQSSKKYQVRLAAVDSFLKRKFEEAETQRAIMHGLPKPPPVVMPVTSIRLVRDELLPKLHQHFISNLESIAHSMSEEPRARLIDAIALAICLNT